MQTVLSIIIVTTNELGLLQTCIQSVKKTVTMVPFELIVIDNASTDGTKKYLAGVKPPFSFRIKTNSKKAGFAENCNKGIANAFGKYILLLNPDTVLQPHAVGRLVRFMDSHPKTGICAPKLLNPDGSLQFSCRRFPTVQSFIARRTPLRFLFSETKTNSKHLMKDANHTRAQQVDWVLGGCICIRKAIIQTVGLPDKQYFLYVDDIDYCLRTWKGGWEVWYVPTAQVIHHHQAKSDKSLLNIYSLYHLKSMIYFTCKHGWILNRKKRHSL